MINLFVAVVVSDIKALREEGFLQNLVNMGELVTGMVVLPTLMHYFKVDTEMNICIHKICPRKKKSLFISFKKMFSSCWNKDQEEEREYCRSEKLPSSMKQITEREYC